MMQSQQYSRNQSEISNGFLDADISKCFDKINHEELLKKINTFPTMRRLIKAWLKSGVMDDGQFFNTNEGTPQGGVISLLLQYSPTWTRTANR